MVERAVERRVRRTLLTAILSALAMLLLAPVGAQARVACPAEEDAITSANGAQVSDAIFCLTNQVRASYGLSAFHRDTRLDAAARLHSQDMAARNFFDHVTPDGRTPSQRAAAQGYKSGVGENIAYNYPTAKAVVLGWMASAGHCRNILGTARDIGIGAAGADAPYYTQAFGDYAFGEGSPRADACPYTLDLDALSDATSTTAAPGATVAGPAADGLTQTISPGAPALRSLAVSRGRLRAGKRGRIAYKLSAPATVTFRVERLIAGRRAGGRCLTATASRRSGAPCVRYRMLPGRLIDAGSKGANTFTFRARLRGRPLAPGRYRLRATATDNSGDGSAPRRAGFVVRG
jgi:uncharacterized protein YkwD